MKFETDCAKRQARVAHRKRMKRLDKSQKRAGKTYKKQYPSHRKLSFHVAEFKHAYYKKQAEQSESYHRMRKISKVLWFFNWLIFFSMWCWYCKVDLVLRFFWRKLFAFGEKDDATIIAELIRDEYEWLTAKRDWLLKIGRKKGGL